MENLASTTSGVHADLHQRAQAVMPSWLKPFYDEPIAIDRGEGTRVWDLEGNSYLDFFGGVLTTMCGHSVPEVVEAIQEQAAKVMHTSTLYLSEPLIKLSEMVTRLSGIPDARVFFTPSGSEANEAALMLATLYRKSNEILAIRNSYHGRTFATIGITSHKSWSPSSLHGLQVHFVQGGYRLRSPFKALPDDDYTQACLQDLTDVLDMMTSGDVAAMIAEPIQGVGGFATPPDGFFGALKKELDNHGILFISDEVQTGWGRTGDHFWGYEAHGIVPDMLTFAKGVGNGLALAGVVARAEVMDAMTATHFSTFGGNPLNSAGAHANLQYLLDNDLQANAKARGEQFRAGLQPTVDANAGIAEMRGRGLMIGIELVEPGGLTPDPSAAMSILQKAKDHGILIGKGGLYGNVLRIAPPLSVSADEIDTAVDALKSAIEATYN